MIRVRFAPTPAGGLLLGSARVALANALFALQGRGQVLLRLDDLETERVRPGAVEQIEQDLRWIGVTWDRCIRQSERGALYAAAIERLQREGRIYPCFETEEELKAKEAFRRRRNQSAIYDRAMLSLTDKQRRDAEAGGKRPHWRFRLSGREIVWDDLVLGPRRAALSAVSDPVLVLADGSPSPVLASVVDDLEFGTTHIIRGEDNAGNTAVQIELFEVLSRRRPKVRFAHLPALQDTGRPASGGRRAGSLSLRGLRQDGIEPGAVLAGLRGIGAADASVQPLEALADGFTLGGLADNRFDMAALLAANRLVLREAPFTAVADRLPTGATEAFWLAVRGSLDLLKEARGWWEVVAGTIVPPVIEGAREVLLAAATLLPPEPWDNGVWGRWIATLEQATQRTGETLMAPLRLALTGEDSGPELSALLPLIGRTRAASRLAVAAA